MRTILGEAGQAGLHWPINMLHACPTLVDEILLAVTPCASRIGGIFVSPLICLLLKPAAGVRFSKLPPNPANHASWSIAPVINLRCYSQTYSDTIYAPPCGWDRED